MASGRGQYLHFRCTGKQNSCFPFSSLVQHVSCAKITCVQDSYWLRVEMLRAGRASQVIYLLAGFDLVRYWTRHIALYEAEIGVVPDAAQSRWEAGPVIVEDDDPFSSF